ncbi:MAG TPA: methylated-DNA--[protein]-cysteine S-methyltransferase [Phycisphaerae bacterium]|nr:methylated-DNA--[protein]-cysteine S-methyltransferase [Phycisphaerae bacterium]
MRLQLDRYPSPLGALLLVTDTDATLRALEFATHEPRLHRLLNSHYPTHTLEPAPAPAPITRALDAYFAGHLDALAAIPTATNGTPFQKSVWAALRQIPPATTITYAQLATAIGRPSASRAVGAANGQNPIAIVVPCHRVIGANNTLTGYASGLPHKHALLSHESKHAPTLTLT